MQQKLNQILKILIEATKSGDLQWQEYNVSEEKRKYSRQMFSMGEDGTKYEIDIKYVNTFAKIQLEPSPNLWLRNPNLPNGIFMVDITKTDPGMLLELRDIIKKMYCSDLNPNTDSVEEVLTDICNGISTKWTRDYKINTLIN